MISFENRLTDQELTNSIKKDFCNRNQDLSSIIKILNHLPDKNTILALDGEWGSGKTCLIREIEILWKSNDNLIPKNQSMDKELEKFRNSYIPFYYNAWENDYAADPSQSLLLALVEYLEEKQDLITKLGRQLLGNLSIKQFLKEKTSGLINLDGVDTSSKVLKHAPEVNKSKKLRAVIAELIENKLKINGKYHFLFIIDDLDRCKPSYAIDLLEAIKNIFNSDKITCLIATNFTELGNVVRGYYGGFIDGHQYLDRIFDYIIRLNNVDPEKYITYKLPGMDTWAFKNVASELRMNMRELNRYLGIIYLYESYLSSGRFVQNQIFYDIYRYIFIPIFVGYRIKNFTVYKSLSSGSGFENIENYLKKNKKMENYASRVLSLKPDEKDKLYENLKKYYDELFSDDQHKKINANNSFWSILNLTSPDLDLN